MTLEEMLRRLADLQAKARGLTDSVKDDTPKADAERIEKEHKEVLAEIRKLEADIAAARAAPAPTPPAAPPAPAADDAASRAAVEAAQRAERERAAAIGDLARTFQLRELGDEHVRRGTPVEAFRGVLLERLSAQSDRTGPANGNTRVEAGDLDETQTRRDAIANALLHRHAPGRFQLTAAGREFRGFTLIELAREVLEASGTRTRSMVRDEVARRAFHTTSDFPAILGNVANTTLRAAYEAQQSNWRPFCRMTNATDFKEKTSVRLGEAPQLVKVNEAGEFTRGSITEGKEKWKIATYGKVIALTRQVIVNDDLDAFTRIPQLFGVSIANLEADIIWGLITGNQLLGDGKGIFHADHKNLVSGAGNVGAPSVETLNATRLKMRQQKGLDGKTRINVSPAFLLVPDALQTGTEQLFAAIVPAQTDKVVPDSMKRLTVIAESRLDDVSTTAWYLAADPNTSAVDTIEYAYLEGNEGAYVETRMGFDVDGMEIKCRIDFGGAAVDSKGLVKNPGQ